jgi:hypothetical protein
MFFKIRIYFLFLSSLRCLMTIKELIIYSSFKTVIQEKMHINIQL